MIRATSSSVPLRSLAGLFLAAGLVFSALPVATATPTTGVWIFPNSKQTEAVEDDLDDSFYIADSENPWLQDSYFADSASDGATVEVDLYNPTGSDLYNVQVFAAYSLENLALVESISFSGGAGGDVSYSGTDLENGGTPQMAGGVAIEDHDVYPAYFVSYSVGDLEAGTNGILTFTIEVVADFANGLIVHLDYTAEDADGNGVSGPFEADMNIFENGESEPPTCTVPTLTLSGTPSDPSPGPGDKLTIRYTAEASDPDAMFGNTDPSHANMWETAAAVGVLWTNAQQEGMDPWTGSVAFDVSLSIPSILLPGDKVTVDTTISGSTCDTALSASDSLTLILTEDATGGAKSAEGWKKEADSTAKGKKHALYNQSEFDFLLQRVALHSEVFVYASWDGTAPTGADDEGWVDIDSIADALNVLEKKTGESKKVRGAEREDLALWLNVAAGALNLDTKLEIHEKKHHIRGAESQYEEATGRSTLSSSYDTPGEILAFLERQIKDWSDGSGASKGDLKLAKRLARSVSNEWLVAA